MKTYLNLSILLPIFLSSCKGYLADWNSPNKLQPVQSLYIRPSADGTTGDLFVAASENNGINSQWVADQAINFLPNQAHQHVPLSYSSTISSSKSPTEEIIASQQRTMISSPPVTYTYPAPSSSDQAAVPYPYSVPATPQCIDPTATVPGHYPAYPYNYYQYLMSAMSASAANALRDPSLSSDIKELSKALSSYAAAAYPSGYGYSWPYYMVNPQAWFQAQVQAQEKNAAPVPSTTPTPTSSTPSQESDSEDDDSE